MVLSSLKDGMRVMLVKNCREAHKFWMPDMRQDCIVEIVNFNGQAFNIKGESGLYPVELIDVERTKAIMQSDT